MDRLVDDINILNNFTTKFCKIVTSHVEYIVVSGFVVISSGRVRGTEDIDMIIRKLDFEKFNFLHSDLIEGGFVCVQGDDSKTVFDYLTNNISVRYTLIDSPLPEMELKFEKDLIDDLQFKTKVKLDLTGLDIWFSSIEMNLAFKEELLKSPKDLEDALYLREIYKGDFSEEVVDKNKSLLKQYR